jgi:hypothetical protein
VARASHRRGQTAVGIGNLGDVSNTAVVVQSSAASLHG